jgi:hypothetical protein
MQRKAGTASTDEKETLRMAKSDEAKAHDNHALKEQQQRSDEPRKKQAAPCTDNRKNQPLRYAPTKVAKHAVPKTERTSL